MKKLLSLFGVLMIFSTLVFAHGKNSPSFAPTGFTLVRDGAVIKVVYKPARHSTVKISIQNENGRVFFSEFINCKDGFVRPYNLSRLPLGKYTVNLIDKNGTHSEEILLEGKREIVYHVRQFKSDPSKYMLTIPAASIEKAIVTMYENGKVIHKEEVELQGDFAKLYTVKHSDQEIFFDVKSIQ